MKLILSLFFLTSSVFMTFSQQGSFTVTVDKDTIFQDEMIKIEFLLDNLSGKFKAPEFESFSVVSGPNTTSTISIINGETNQKKSYSFILVPEISGRLVIDQASVATESGVLLSDPIDIYVLETGDRTHQSQSHKRIFKYDNGTKSPSDSKLSPTKRVMKKI